MSKNFYSIIRRPIISEKSINLRETLNQVTFEVSRDANKIEIRRAVESLLEAKVASVNTMIVRGKVKRMGKYSGRRPNWKKAIVTLLDGESIEALDLVGQFPEDESEGEE
jgi:large subunit ribosomal protein L23